MPTSPLTDAEIERKIHNAEQQLAHQDTGFFVPFDEYIPVYRELLARRAEYARLVGELTEAVENHQATYRAFGDRAKAEHDRAIAAEDECERLKGIVRGIAALDLALVFCDRCHTRNGSPEAHDELCPYRLAAEYVEASGQDAEGQL